MTEVLTGGCLCGAVTYRVRAPYLKFAHCYCSRCRKATGTGHATNLYVDPGHFEWTSGETSAVRYDLMTAKSFATTFCKHCGSPLPHLTRSGKIMVIPAGSFDTAPDLKVQARIFWGSRAAWSCVDDQVPAFESLPDWW